MMTIDMIESDSSCTVQFACFCLFVCLLPDLSLKYVDIIYKSEWAGKLSFFF